MVTNSLPVVTCVILSCSFAEMKSPESQIYVILLGHPQDTESYIFQKLIWINISTMSAHEFTHNFMDICFLSASTVVCE